MTPATRREVDRRRQSVLPRAGEVRAIGMTFAETRATRGALREESDGHLLGASGAAMERYGVNTIVLATDDARRGAANRAHSA